MSLRVVGAGLGRTGTQSLKHALERVLGAPCYHMTELFRRPGDVAGWHDAARGQMPDWRSFLGGYAAAVDWPAASFWREMSAAFPDAIVLLSVRDAESWWRSANATIFQALSKMHGEHGAMMRSLFGSRFTLSLADKDACIAAYEEHVADVRKHADPKRLIEWRPADGWTPLCRALGVPVPDAPFPHENTTGEFQSRHA